MDSQAFADILDPAMIPWVILALWVALAVLWIAKRPQTATMVPPPAAADHVPVKDTVTRGAAKGPKMAAAPKASFADSQHLAAVLKGHTDTVNDVQFTPDGKALASLSADSSIRLWDVSSLTDKGRAPPTRIDLSPEHGSKMYFSSDSKNVLVALQSGLLRVCKVGRVDPLLTFPDAPVSAFPCVGVGIGGRARVLPGESAPPPFLVAAHEQPTTLTFWSLHGALLQTIDTKMVTLSCLKVSPNGVFVGVSGFTNEVKLFTVVGGTGQSFVQARRASELCGHRAGIYSFCFSVDSLLVVTVSKDKTWRIFSLDVDWRHGQDCRVLVEGTYPHAGPAVVALAPDRLTVAIASGTTLSLFNAGTGALLAQMPQCVPDVFFSLDFDAESRFLASCVRGKQIFVWHNTSGLQLKLKTLEDDLRNAAKDTIKDRIRGQIVAAEADLRSIIGSTAPNA